MPSPHRIAIAASFAFTVAIGSAAFAQTTAPVAPTMTPAPNCENPGEAPSLSTSELGRSAAEAKRNTWTRKMKAYLDCLKSFVSDQQAAAAPHIKAANAGVEEFNKAIKIYNDQLDAAKQ
jgi:hypothetical protein